MLVLLLVPLLNISDFLICYIEVWSSSELCEEVFTTCETQEWSETDQNVYVPFETRHHDHPAYNCYDYNDDELCVIMLFSIRMQSNHKVERHKMALIFFF